MRRSLYTLAFLATLPILVATAPFSPLGFVAGAAGGGLASFLASFLIGISGWPLALAIIGGAVVGGVLASDEDFTLWRREVQDDDTGAVIKSVIEEYATKPGGIELLIDRGAAWIKEESQTGGVLDGKEPPQSFVRLIANVQRATTSDAQDKMGTAYDLPEKLPPQVLTWARDLTGGVWEEGA